MSKIQALEPKKKSPKKREKIPSSLEGQQKTEERKGKKVKKKTDILDVMKKNPREMEIKEISQLCGQTEPAVFIWLCSIGKAIPEIIKISHGVYIYKSPE
jgi:hypothetical protein